MSVTIMFISGEGQCEGEGFPGGRGRHRRGRGREATAKHTHATEKEVKGSVPSFTVTHATIQVPPIKM